MRYPARPARRTPLFPAPEKREGYLRADPGKPLAVAAAVFEAAQLIGTFEKPLYVRLEEPLCAHSRAGADRLHQLSGHLPDRGDHAGRRSC